LHTEVRFRNSFGFAEVSSGCYVSDVSRQGIPYLVLHRYDASLYDAMQALGFEDILKVMAKVCIPVKLMHEAGYAHMDIRPTNILMDLECTECLDVIVKISRLDERDIVLSDFGQAMLVDEGRKTEVITRNDYTPPEQDIGYCTLKSDVWGLGRTYLDMLLGGIKSFADRSFYPVKYEETGSRFGIIRVPVYDYDAIRMRILSIHGGDEHIAEAADSSIDLLKQVFVKEEDRISLDEFAEGIKAIRRNYLHGHGSALAESINN
jgi:serine/threonine protein kinase